MPTTIELLDKLADMQAQADVIKMHYEELRDSVMTPEIKQALSDIAAEEAESLARVDNNISTLTGEIKELVIVAGASVKGAYLQAVWSKPRVSWDTKALDGYSAAHPELLTFRKEGDPSVSIRKV